MEKVGGIKEYVQKRIAELEEDADDFAREIEKHPYAAQYVCDMEVGIDRVEHIVRELRDLLTWLDE